MDHYPCVCLAYCLAYWLAYCLGNVLGTGSQSDHEADSHAVSDIEVHRIFPYNSIMSCLFLKCCDHGFPHVDGSKHVFFHTDGGCEHPASHERIMIEATNQSTQSTLSSYWDLMG